ncbi:hypothetical protein [Streptomyces sp. NRRL S-623]|uniref:hypothetical protein n=1 Tax=Streptomyces sp. NRRL S-623 TaxID=1463916 RepID=UPI001F42054D|nr:hypothetical protein [Streptomyces sp. NRRL S-623]
MPDEQTHLALSEHARTLGIKGRAFQRAKEQLVVNGFVHERRVSGERGLWVTQQLFSNVPLSDGDALGVWREAGVGGDPSPGAHFPTVGEPGPRTVGRQLPVGEEREKNSSRPPTETRDSNESLVDVELRRVLSSALPPDGVRSAVGFLGHRLVRKMPETPVEEQAVAERSEPSLAAEPVVLPPYVPAPLVTCQGPGTEHVFRSMGGETECPDCQQAAAWARWAERRAADLGVDLAEDAAKAVEDGRDPGGWRGRLAASASGATGVPGGQ